ncbi:thiamine pyrophosphate-binding protein [Kocuria kalidii]|uniref:thiamine pyrophosphate-binding protein n=1 Tax=Kocuria kalidii TaxID=3376283 RepID=UPI0037892F7B
MTTVSTRIVEALAPYVAEVFGVMGNGNAHFLDAVEASDLSFTAVRHEAGAVAAADAYSRVSGRVAVATTTYGAGFTNAITPLTEARQARIPLVMVTGEAPTTGARPWDVDQPGIGADVGVDTFVVDARQPGLISIKALERAVQHRQPVVLAIPYDLAAADADEESWPEPVLQAPTLQPSRSDLERVAAALNTARRPLLLAGRGARVAGADPAIERLSDQLGALSATTVAARNLLNDAGHLGIAGGFGTDAGAKLMAEADVVVVFGAGLNQFTTRFGHLFGQESTVIQIDLADKATHPRVDHHLRADARLVAERLSERVPARRDDRWRDAAAGRVRRWADTEPGDPLAPDGRLDPRSLSVALNRAIPANRVVVQDGGHFSGWAPMYWDIPGPHALNLVGTAYQTIGLGLPAAVGAGRAAPESTVVLTTGDGGMLMSLADLETVVRSVASGIIVVFNDAAYGAEVHQYGSIGLAPAPMLIPDVDFAGMAAALGAHAVTVRTLEDLHALNAWVGTGAQGVLVLDCKISKDVIAPYMTEILDVAKRSRATPSTTR